MTLLVVIKGPRDWGGLGGLSGGDMIVKQPDMKLDDLLDDSYYYDGLADQKFSGNDSGRKSCMTGSWILNLGAQIVCNDKRANQSHPQRALDYMRYYSLAGWAALSVARLPGRMRKRERRLGRTVITDVITDGERVTGAVGFAARAGCPPLVKVHHPASPLIRAAEALLPSEHASQRRRQHRLERGLRHAEFRILEGVERACRFRVEGQTGLSPREPGS